MANPHRGEVEFELDGQTRMLRLNTNTICALEQQLNLGVDEISSRMIQGFLSVLRAVLRAAIVKLPAEGDMTLEQAGNLIDALGPQRTVRLLMQAFRLAFPEAEQDADPPTGGEAGTGANC